MARPPLGAEVCARPDVLWLLGAAYFMLACIDVLFFLYR